MSGASTTGNRFSDWWGPGPSVPLTGLNSDLIIFPLLALASFEGTNSPLIALEPACVAPVKYSKP